MEQYKLDFFKKDHKNQNLSFVTLSMEECDKVFASFCLSYKIAPLYRNDIFSIIQSEGRFVNSVNAKDENFDLRRLIYEQNIKEMPNVGILFIRLMLLISKMLLTFLTIYGIRRLMI